MKITTTPSNRIGYIKETRVQFDRAGAFDEFEVFDDHFYKKPFAKRAKWAIDPFEEMTGRKKR